MSDEMHHFMDWGHVCALECDKFANGCVCERVRVWLGVRGGFFFPFFVFFSPFFPRFSPASKWSVCPPPFLSLRAAGRRSGNKKKNQNSENNHHQTNRIVSQDGESLTWPRLPPSVCVSCDPSPSLSSILRPCHPPLSVSPSICLLAPPPDPPFSQNDTLPAPPPDCPPYKQPLIMVLPPSSSVRTLCFWSRCHANSPLSCVPFKLLETPT